MSRPRDTDAIFARASGAGKAGLAVFRLSGRGALAIAAALAGGASPARRATLRTLMNAAGETIDQGLVLVFPAPRSFTGEDVAEFHLHGGRAVEAALAEALAAAGARPAEAGEFTLRAFRNGRLDLAQAEALADLIDAETSEQRRQAVAQMGGGLSALATAWRERLIAALVPLEAAIDFPDEEGVPADIAARAVPVILALEEELGARLEESIRLQNIRTGIEIAVIGAPNAGKSSLLNRLAGMEAAIVAETPGTTRDVVEVRLDLAGLPVLLADTAGLRDGPLDPVEREGMARARARAERAALRLLVVDAAAPDAAAGRDLARPGDFLVFNKADLAAPAAGGAGDLRVFSLSAKTGAGVQPFVAALAGEVRARYGGGEGAGLTRLRHAEAAKKARAALARARGRVASAPELAAEDVRLAARALGEITGAVDVEDVLGAIFSRFCIGK